MSDLLARIAQEREERVQHLTLDLPVPTWDGDLIARFEIMPRKVLEDFAKRKRTPEVDMDFILQSVTALYVRDQEKVLDDAQRNDKDDNYALLADENGVPVKFDNRLAQKLGIPAEKARDVLLFCFKDNTIAVSAMAIKAIQWMQNTDATVAEAIVGE